MRMRSLGLLLAALPLAVPVLAQQPGVVDATFSVIGRDPETGDMGIAVASRTIAVGARVMGGKGGVAVFAHQSASNPMYSIMGTDLIEKGMSPQQALEFMLRADNGGGSRQVAILDAKGRTAAWTSPTISDWKGHKCAENYCVQGNTLTGADVVEAMSAAFEKSVGQPLHWRLADALEAGEAAGGDRRGKQSAGLLILRPLGLQGFSDRWLDLRVDEHATPIQELKRILQASRPRPRAP